MTAAVVLGGAACQNAPTAPSLSPTAPTDLAPAWLSTGATRFQPPVDLSACLSAPSPACFTAPRTQAAVIGAAPVTGPPINLAGAVNNTTVTLTWTPPGFQDAPVISYLIDVGSTPNFPAPDLVSIETFSTSTTLEASGVPPGLTTCAFARGTRSASALPRTRYRSSSASSPSLARVVPVHRDRSPAPGQLAPSRCRGSHH